MLKQDLFPTFILRIRSQARLQARLQASCIVLARLEYITYYNQ